MQQTAAPREMTKRERTMQKRDRRESRINEALGFSSREERLQHDRYSYGTGGGRQAPRHREGAVEGFKPMCAEDHDVFMELIEAVGHMPEGKQTSGQPFKFSVGDHLNIRLIEKDWRVEIVKRHDWIGHLRYTLNFLDADSKFSVTQGQLERLIVAADPRPSWLELLTAALSLQADYYAALLGLE